MLRNKFTVPPSYLRPIHHQQAFSVFAKVNNEPTSEPLEKGEEVNARTQFQKKNGLSQEEIQEKRINDYNESNDINSTKNTEYIPGSHKKLVDVE